MAKGTRATTLLDKAGIAYRVHAYDYHADGDSKAQAAADALGIEPARMFKTLMAWVDKQPLVAVIPGDKRLSLKKLAASCGGKQAQMMDIAEAERRSGYSVGGISPLAQQRPARIVFARTALEHERLYLNAGQRGLLLELDPQALLGLLQASCADICDD